MDDSSHDSSSTELNEQLLEELLQEEKEYVVRNKKKKHLKQQENLTKLKVMQIFQVTSYIYVRRLKIQLFLFYIT